MIKRIADMLQAPDIDTYNVFTLLAAQTHQICPKRVTPEQEAAENTRDNRVIYGYFGKEPK